MKFTVLFCYRLVFFLYLYLSINLQYCYVNLALTNHSLIQFYFKNITTRTDVNFCFFVFVFY